jgi:hypothetical protein
VKRAAPSSRRLAVDPLRARAGLGQVDRLADLRLDGGGQPAVLTDLITGVLLFAKCTILRSVRSLRSRAEGFTSAAILWSVVLIAAALNSNLVADPRGH